MLRSLLRSLSALAALALVLVPGVPAALAEAPLAASPLPLSFEQNRGQVASRYSFLFRHDGTEALFLPEGVDLQFINARTHRSEHLGLRLLLEAQGVSVHSELPLEGRTNYLLGADATRWVRGVPTFSRIHYTAVYPGVDLVFYGKDGRLEHDYRVAPGADAGRIAFRLDGAERLELTPAGDLAVQLTDGDRVVLERPVAYQEGSQGRQRVPADFTIASNGTVAFRLGAYDHARELVVDPALTYATYLDKLSLGVAAIATDSTGATYVTGYAFQSTYGTTPGAFQPICPACTNTAPAGYVTKIDPTGTKVLYSTFLGGSGYTEPLAIAVDGNGDAVIGGYTKAGNFPVKNNAGSGEGSVSTSAAFISSLAPDGSALNFSSVFAGNSDNVVFGVALDAQGNTYIAGNAHASNYPVTPGALNAGLPAFDHTYGFLTKLTPAGSLTYSALVGNEDPQNGGGGFIGVQGLAVDAQGNAYLTGSAGTLWPTTPGAYQTTIPGAAPYDAPYVTKVSADGSHLIFSTFVGIGLGQAIAVDSSGNIDLLSSTSESGTTYASYLSQLSPDGSQLLHNTALGSTSGGASYPASLAIDPSGNLWIAGSTTDTAYPVLHPLGPSFPGSLPSTTGFLSEFDSTGTSLKFSTLYGNGSSSIASIAIAPSGIVSLAGTTEEGIYTTPNSLIPSVPPPEPDYYTEYGFLARIDPSKASAAVCVSNRLSGFPGLETPVGTPITLSLPITSCGELPLTLSSVQSSSSLFTAQDPAAACGSSLAPGASCTISITFLPTHSGTFTTVLTLVSNASIPSTTVSLTDTGTPLPPTFSRTALTFNTTPGVASPNQTITVTNVSDIPLTFTQTNVTQPFTVSNTCAPQLAPGLSCSILVGFSSATAGTFNGSLYLSESQFQYNQQTITLTGFAGSPTVTVGPTTPAAATQTVAAGQPATFSLTTASVGNYSGAATFSCSNLPQYAACSFAPSSVTLAAGATAPVLLTITTKQGAAAALRPLLPGSGAVLILAAFGAPLLWISRREGSALGRAGLLMLGLCAIGIGSSVLLTGCGGGSHAGPTPTPTTLTTPAGTYAISVNAQLGSATVSAPVTLIVH